MEKIMQTSIYQIVATVQWLTYEWDGVIFHLDLCSHDVWEGGRGEVDGRWRAMLCATLIYTLCVLKNPALLLTRMTCVSL